MFNGGGGGGGKGTGEAASESKVAAVQQSIPGNGYSCNSVLLLNTAAAAAANATNAATNANLTDSYRSSNLNSNPNHHPQPHSHNHHHHHSYYPNHIPNLNTTAGRPPPLSPPVMMMMNNGGGGGGGDSNGDASIVLFRTPTLKKSKSIQNHNNNNNNNNNNNKFVYNTNKKEAIATEIIDHHHRKSSSLITLFVMLINSKKCLISLFGTLILLIVLLLLTVILAQNNNNNATVTTVCYTDSCRAEAKQIDASLNRNVSVCDDFYEFVCGSWMANIVIPEHKPQETRFEQLQDQVKHEIKSLLQIPINPEKDPDYVLKMKRFYQSCLNTTAIDMQGDKPLRHLISFLGGWPILDSNWNSNSSNTNSSEEEEEQNTTLTLVEIHRRFRELGVNDDMILSVTVVPYDKNNTRNIIGISQPSLGLLDRDMMVKDLQNDTAVQRYYRLMLYTAQLLLVVPDANANSIATATTTPTNVTEPQFDFDKYDEDNIDGDIDVPDELKRDMQEVLHFEQQLAEHSLKKEDNRNLTLLFNNMTIEKLENITSANIEWLHLINVLSGRNLTKNEEIVVFDLGYVQFIGDFLPKVPKRVLFNYMLWRVVKNKIGTLHQTYRRLKERYNSVSFGNTKPEPRWMQCVSQVQLYLGTALSNVYVKSQFSRGDKEAINKIVLDIKAEFYETLKNTEWMDHQTRQHGIEKLQSMEFRIGYPDEIVYDELISGFYHFLNITDDGTYFDNVLAIGKFVIDSAFMALTEPNYRDDWRKFSEVVDVNAYYFHQENTFILNAGLLQGIFFNPHRPNYLNYGAIGEIIGHEITHGFDSFGKQFDRDGQLKNWWNPATAEMFEEKSRCIVEQYNLYYSPEVDMYLNGMITQDENIADNGGVELAYRAYQRAYANNRSARIESQLPGHNFTNEQMFWISYGICNCEKMSNEMLRLNIQMDSHSPSRFRLNGVVSNSYHFAKDFNCPLGSPMNPKVKCKVW